MRCRAAWVLTSLIAFVAMGCNGSSTGPDGATDVPMNNDTLMGDVHVTPDGGDAGPGDGASEAGLCNTLPIENLNTLSPATGGHTDYISMTGTTPGPGAGIQVPTNVAGTDTSPGRCFFGIGHQRVFAYTPATTSILKVSTTNPMTNPFLDTVIYIADPTVATVCSAHAPNATDFVGCNDDDPNYAGDQRRISSTAVSAAQVMAGHTVYIALGGYTPVGGAGADQTREEGTFELTVDELAPVAAAGACDTPRLVHPCADGTTCVSSALPSTMGTCQTNGMAAGTACGGGGACSGTGLTCEAGGYCAIEGVANGMPCDAFHLCGATSTCVTQLNGSSTGTCAANGSVVGAACDASTECTEGTGLACDVDNPTGTGPVCRLALSTPGAACNSATDTCPTNSNPAMNQDCVTSTPSGLTGTCAATAAGSGSHCGGTCSGTGESCVTPTGAVTGTCETTATTGGACSPTAQCGTGDACFLTDLTDVFDGQCFTGGTLGGACDGTTTCGTGLTCSDPTGANGRCGNMAADGAHCGLSDVCPTGETCVQDPSMATYSGTCRMQGAAAGAQCVRMPGSAMPACTGSMTCSSWIPEEGICQNISTDGTCDARTAETRCAAPMVCRSSSIHSAGSCTAPTAETEPNDTVMQATAATPPSAYQGALSLGDVDCYSVSVGAGQNFYAAATMVSGTCGGVTMAIDVYRVDAAHGNLLTWLGTDENSGTQRCPRIEGGDASHNFDWATNSLATADTWYACVRNATQISQATPEINPIPGYVLSLALH